MNKKIQIAAVEMKALSEVIVLNTSFVARTVRAAEILKPIKACIEGTYTEFLMDENGNGKIDGKGNPATRLVFNKMSCCLTGDQAESLYNTIIPFMEDLCKALLGEEA